MEKNCRGCQARVLCPACPEDLHRIQVCSLPLPENEGGKCYKVTFQQNGKEVCGVCAANNR